MEEAMHYYFDVVRENRRDQSHKQIVIIIAIGNAITIATDQKYDLDQDELLILNNDMDYRMQLKPGAKALVFQISSYDIRKLFHHTYYFYGNSHEEKGRKYQVLQRHIASLIRLSYDQSVYREVETIKAFAQFLIFFVDQFALETIQEQDLAHRLKDYVEENYEENLSLSDASAAFHMTPQYFSKLFKETVGLNYHNYLRKLQLNHALDDLVHTDTSLLHIALNNGFPNAKAFQSYFQKEYGLTPLAYRQKYKKAVIKEEDIRSLFEKENEGEEEHYLIINALSYKPYKKFWSEILSLGKYHDFQDANIQQQLIYTQERFHFSYLRIDMNIEHFLSSTHYSFYYEENFFDILIHAHFSLWFVIDFRNQQLMNHIEEYLKGLLSHFANRYSIDNIRKWRFEVSYNTFFDSQKHHDYETACKRIYGILQKFGCENNIVGASVTLDYKKSVVPFLEEKHLLKDYTFTDMPLRFHDALQTSQLVKDASFLKNDIEMLKESTLYRKNTFPIYITDLIDNLMDYNILNDACYKGAFTIKTIIDLFGDVAALSCMMPFDLLEVNALGEAELFGGKGLMTKRNIKKPSWYAYEFLSRLASYFITKDDHSLVTTNKENYQIICHNCKNLSYKYYLDETHTSYESMNAYFEDEEQLQCHFHFENMKNGRYLIKRRYVNEQFGSILDNYYALMGQDKLSLGDGEIAYLKQISTPREVLDEVEVKDGVMDLKMTLEKNEFDYVHIIYRY